MTWAFVLIACATGTVVGAPLTPERGFALIERLQSAEPEQRARARAQLIAADDPSVAAPLVELIFFSKNARGDAQVILESLFDVATPKDVRPYKFWLEEIGRRQEIEPLTGYLELKSRLYSKIDPSFGAFLDPTHPRTIRPEEIVFGGVQKDGIPALDRPKTVDANEAAWMRDDELIFGLFVDGEARAYPRRILDWHEMANDVIGETPVSLAWCTLCGSAIAYRGTLEGRTYTFGTSGLLYRSNKLMYDRQTDTLWSQLSGEPVMGPLVGKGLKLERLPVIVTTWKDWTTIHPDTRVVSRETGYARDYERPPYTAYFASDELMFPVWKKDERLDRKEWVWAAQIGESSRAWRVADLQKSPILNDQVGEQAVLLLTNPRSGGVRMYERPAGLRFVSIDDGSVVTDGKERFRITEDALVGDNGMRLPRLPGHEAFWFAWSASHPDTSLYEP